MKEIWNELFEMSEEKKHMTFFMFLMNVQKIIDSSNSNKHKFKKMNHFEKNSINDLLTEKKFDWNKYKTMTNRDKSDSFTNDDNDLEIENNFVDERNYMNNFNDDDVNQFSITIKNHWVNTLSKCRRITKTKHWTR